MLACMVANKEWLLYQLCMQACLLREMRNAIRKLACVLTTVSNAILHGNMHMLTLMWNTMKHHPQTVIRYMMIVHYIYGLIIKSMISNLSLSIWSMPNILLNCQPATSNPKDYFSLSVVSCLDDLLNISHIKVSYIFERCHRTRMVRTWMVEQLARVDQHLHFMHCWLTKLKDSATKYNSRLPTDWLISIFWSVCLGECGTWF